MRLQQIDISGFGSYQQASIDLREISSAVIMGAQRGRQIHGVCGLRPVGLVRAMPHGDGCHAAHRCF